MYYILYAILYLISLIPLNGLYLFSDFLFLVLYKIAGYRTAVVRENLSRSFPEKTKIELNIIEKEFYKNLCDSIVETIKLISISKEELDKRMVVNWELLQSENNQGRVIQAYMSHFFNWEWGTVLCNWKTDYRFTGMYLPISNKVFDKLMYTIRARSGTKLLPVQDMMQQLPELQKQKTLWGFIADQNPSDPKRVSWNLFLGRETAFAKGGEFVARRYNNPVYFGQTIKLKRGYYQIKLKLVCDNPRDTKDGELTETYVRLLEECIKHQPSNWVWSHRRWKHQYAVE